MAKTASIFFLSLFWAFIITPTVVVIVESTADISLVYALSEEEHEEVSLQETQSKIVPVPFDLRYVDVYLPNKMRAGYNSTRWSPIHMDTFSPPPERV